MFEWMQAHETLSRLARQRAVADADEGRWLLRAYRAASHVHLGFASFHEYVERLFGYRPRSTREKLRVAQALEALPALSSALAAGRSSWSAARELTRVAVRETEAQWLALADGKSLRQLEELVSGKRLGDLPSSAPDPAIVRHVLRFEVTAETFALVREALCELRRRSESSLDDDSALLEMARHVLLGPGDTGRSSYQIALRICPECSSACQPANGQNIAIGPEIAAMAQCDAQRIPTIEVDPPAAHVGHKARQTIPPALRRAVMQRDQRRCRVPGCTNATFLDLHHIHRRSDGGRHDAANLIAVCSAHHRALHRGAIRTTGDADNLAVVHANGRRYGEPAPATLDVQTKVASGLRGLGFRETEVRLVMSELQQREELVDASPQQWLREALALLQRARSR